VLSRFFCGSLKLFSARSSKLVGSRSFFGYTRQYETFEISAAWIKKSD